MPHTGAKRNEPRHVIGNGSKIVKMFRKGRGSSASAALQKGASLLHRSRPHSTTGRRALDDDDDDEDLGAYLSSLSRKTTNQPDWDKYDVSDISLSSDDLNEAAKAKVTTAGSKFLKKKAPPETNTSKPQLSKAGPQTSKSVGKFAQPQTMGNKRSSALDKLASLSNKYGKKPNREAAKLSDSDLDLDMSMDEDVIADMQSIRKGSGPGPSNSLVKTKSSASSKPVVSRVAQSSSISISDDSEVGKGGSRFLKKKPTQQPPVEVSAEVKKSDDFGDREPMLGQGGPRQSMFTLKSAEKYSTTVRLDTDEESLADFIGGLSPASSSDITSGSKTPRTNAAAKAKAFLRAATPTGKVSPEPMDDISEKDETKYSESDAHSLTESVSSGDNIKGMTVNLMDLDALEPAESPPLSPAAVVTPTEKTKTTKSKNKENKPPAMPTSKDKKLVEKVTPKKTKEKKNDVFSSMGLHSVDELFGSDHEVSEASDVATGTVKSETEPRYESDFEPKSPSPPPLRSILAVTPRSQTPRSARSRVRLSLTDINEARSPSPEAISTARVSITSIAYTEDFDEESGSEKTGGTIKSEKESDSEDLSEETMPGSGRSSPSRSSRRSRRKSSTDYYSDDFTSGTETTSKKSRRYSRSSSRDSDATYSDSYTSYTGESSTERSRSPERRVRRYSVEMRTVEVQTGLEPGLAYHWNTEHSGYAAAGMHYGLSFTDPTPIATHVVGADALEAMTAYSPSVLALNDMLKQQLQLTNQFVHAHRHLHQAYVSSIQPDYQYTTLEDTKQYIKKHQKPKLTFEEALKQVKAEMNMEL